MRYLVLFFLAIAVFFVNVMIRGFVTYKMYYWFIFPLAKGLPHINIYIAYGFALFVSSITANIDKEMRDNKTDDRETDEKIATSLIGNVIYGGAMLLLGWIFSSLV
jgi:hypothetical protein